jgi:hypothetical protein
MDYNLRSLTLPIDEIRSGLEFNAPRILCLRQEPITLRKRVVIFITVFAELNGFSVRQAEELRQMYLVPYGTAVLPPVAPHAEPPSPPPAPPPPRQVSSLQAQVKTARAATTAQSATLRSEQRDIASAENDGHGANSRFYVPPIGLEQELQTTQARLTQSRRALATAEANLAAALAAKKTADDYKPGPPPIAVSNSVTTQFKPIYERATREGSVLQAQIGSNESQLTALRAQMNDPADLNGTGMLARIQAQNHLQLQLEQQIQGERSRLGTANSVARAANAILYRQQAGVDGSSMSAQYATLRQAGVITASGALTPGLKLTSAQSTAYDQFVVTATRFNADESQVSNQNVAAADASWNVAKAMAGLDQHQRDMVLLQSQHPSDLAQQLPEAQLTVARSQAALDQALAYSQKVNASQLVAAAKLAVQGADSPASRARAQQLLAQDLSQQEIAQAGFLAASAEVSADAPLGALAKAQGKLGALERQAGTVCLPSGAPLEQQIIQAQKAVAQASAASQPSQLVDENLGAYANLLTKNYALWQAGTTTGRASAHLQQQLAQSRYDSSTFNLTLPSNLLDPTNAADQNAEQQAWAAFVGEHHMRLSDAAVISTLQQLKPGQRVNVRVGIKELETEEKQEKNILADRPLLEQGWDAATQAHAQTQTYLQQQLAALEALSRQNGLDVGAFNEKYLQLMGNASTQFDALSLGQTHDSQNWMDAEHTVEDVAAATVAMAITAATAGLGSGLAVTGLALLAGTEGGFVTSQAFAAGQNWLTASEGGEVEDNSQVSLLAAALFPNGYGGMNSAEREQALVDGGVDAINALGNSAGVEAGSAFSNLAVQRLLPTLLTSIGVKGLELAPEEATTAEIAQIAETNLQKSLLLRVTSGVAGMLGNQVAAGGGQILGTTTQALYALSQGRLTSGQAADQIASAIGQFVTNLPSGLAVGAFGGAAPGGLLWQIGFNLGSSAALTLAPAMLSEPFTGANFSNAMVSTLLNAASSTIVGRATLADDVRQPAQSLWDHGDSLQSRFNHDRSFTTHPLQTIAGLSREFADRTYRSFKPSTREYPTEAQLGPAAPDANSGGALVKTPEAVIPILEPSRLPRPLELFARLHAQLRSNYAGLTEINFRTSHTTLGSQRVRYLSGAFEGSFPDEAAPGSSYVDDQLSGLRQKFGSPPPTWDAQTLGLIDLQLKAAGVSPDPKVREAATFFAATMRRDSGKVFSDDEQAALLAWRATERDSRFTGKKKAGVLSSNAQAALRRAFDNTSFEPRPDDWKAVKAWAGNGSSTLGEFARVVLRSAWGTRAPEAGEPLNADQTLAFGQMVLKAWKDGVGTGSESFAKVLRSTQLTKQGWEALRTLSQNAADSPVEKLATAGSKALVALGDKWAAGPLTPTQMDALVPLFDADRETSWVGGMRIAPSVKGELSLRGQDLGMPKGAAAPEQWESQSQWRAYKDYIGLMERSRDPAVRQAAAKARDPLHASAEEDPDARLVAKNARFPRTKPKEGSLVPPELQGALTDLVAADRASWDRPRDPHFDDTTTRRPDRGAAMRDVGVAQHPSAILIAQLEEGLTQPGAKLIAALGFPTYQVIFDFSEAMNVPAPYGFAVPNDPADPGAGYHPNLMKRDDGRHEFASDAYVKIVAQRTQRLRLPSFPNAIPGVRLRAEIEVHTTKYLGNFVDDTGRVRPGYTVIPKGTIVDPQGEKFLEVAFDHARSPYRAKGKIADMWDGIYRPLSIAKAAFNSEYWRRTTFGSIIPREAQTGVRLVQDRTDLVGVVSLGLEFPFADTIKSVLNIKPPSLTFYSFQAEGVTRYLRYHQSEDHTPTTPDGVKIADATHAPSPVTPRQRKVEIAIDAAITAATVATFASGRHLWGGTTRTVSGNTGAAPGHGHPARGNTTPGTAGTGTPHTSRHRKVSLPPLTFPLQGSKSSHPHSLPGGRTCRG